MKSTYDPTKTYKQLTNGEARDFMFAGSALFTVRNSETGVRFTYEVKVSRPQLSGGPAPTFDDAGKRILNGPFWVSVRGKAKPNSSELETDIDPHVGGSFYMGGIFDRSTFKLTKKGREVHGFKDSDQAVKVFGWIFDHLIDGTLPEAIEFWHAGECGRCGLALTDPKSIEAGFGPTCRKAMVAPAGKFERSADDIIKELGY